MMDIDGSKKLHQTKTEFIFRKDFVDTGWIIGVGKYFNPRKTCEVVS